jgi:hypothetical protein
MSSAKVSAFCNMTQRRLMKVNRVMRRRTNNPALVQLE